MEYVMRIAVISEEITSRASDGILVFLHQMCGYLSAGHDTLLVHRSGTPDPELESKRVPGSGPINARELRVILGEWKPDILIHAPASGLTGFGLLRTVLLKRVTGLPVVVVAMQARETGRMHRMISLWSAPELVLSPVREMRQALESLRINTDLIMPGYDPSLFKKTDEVTKKRLRDKYQLPRDRYIVLHVGHIREKRNMQAFLRHRDWGPDVQPVIKAGEVDPVWVAHLRQAGVIVIDEYTDEIHEIYQAADMYLFPVTDRSEALEFPLSVIEAAACDLPVIATRFGSLPDILDEGGGLEWFSSVSEIPDRIARLRKESAETRSKVIDLSWERLFERYLMSHLYSLVPPA